MQIRVGAASGRGIPVVPGEGDPLGDERRSGHAMPGAAQSAARDSDQARRVKRRIDGRFTSRRRRTLWSARGVWTYRDRADAKGVEDQTTDAVKG